MPNIRGIELGLLWAVWGYPFIFRAPHRQKRPSVTLANATRIGLLIEAIGIVASYAGRPVAPNGIRMVVALLFALPAIFLGFGAVTHLGRQFRITAGLYEDHELVRTGPYALVRHPIYGSLLAMLLATISLITPWWRTLISVCLYLAGTEIRVRAEDRLLASRFGPAFEEYRRAVPAYIPFIR